MTILAFDTSGKSCSAAVGTSGQVLASSFKLMERGQSEALVPMIVEVMQKAQKDFQELRQIIVTLGPGAFTGLRIGLAAAKALKLATNAQVQGITTFMAVALGLKIPSHIEEILIAIDSKRAEIFFQRFSPELENIGQPFALLPQDLPVPGKPTLIAGDGGRFLGHLGLDWQEETIPNSYNIVNNSHLLKQLLPLDAIYLRAPDVTVKTKT